MLTIKRVYSKTRHKMNFVPFIDVIFMLLMFFFVAATIRPTEANYQTNLPGGSGPANQKVLAKEAYRVYMRKLDDAGTQVEVSINGEVLGVSPGAFKTLEERLNSVTKKENMIIVIDGDPSVNIQFVAHALDSAVAAKVPSITFGKPKVSN